MGKKSFDKTLTLIFLSLSLLFALMIFSGSFSGIRNTLTDGLQGDRQPLSNILIVEIDDQSIQKIGRWPWNRDVYADFLDKVNDAKVIGFDISFFEKSENDEKLRKKISEIDNLILAEEINNGEIYSPIFESKRGFVNILSDGGGIARGFEHTKFGEKAFAVKIYEEAFRKSFDSDDDILNINYIGEPGSFESISFHDVLINGGDFSGKILLVGATAPNLHDTYFVPTSDGVEMSGVEIHANIIQNIVLDSFVKKQGELGTFLIVLIFGLFGIFISRLKVYYFIPILICTIIFYSLIGIILFQKNNYQIDLFFVPLSLIAFSGIGVGYNYLQERRHSNYLTEAFGKYLSKDLVKKIAGKEHSLKLGGQRKKITIFFSDIRGFTSISEKMKADELVEFVNEYLTEMTEIIMKHKGTVDKFIGDAIMAFWNAPFEIKDHEKVACECAIAQVKALRKLQKNFEDRKLPKIDIGCGLNTGEAVVGNMGSENRFDYTAMGDSVNLASRLEGLTKQYGVSIVISESTYRKVNKYFDCRLLDKVKVKGKNIPIKIYELCVEADKRFLKAFDSAISLYFNGKFRSAIKGFEKAIDLKKGDVSCKLFIERCNEYIKSNPGKNWDGSFEMKTK